MAERLNVFISSTFADLEPYRKQVINVVLRLGCFPIAMEAFNSTNRNAMQLCYDKLQEADIFIGIYAHRYGFVPDIAMSYRTIKGDIQYGDGQRGLTHWEYVWAKEKNIPTLLFIISDKDEHKQLLYWPDELREGEPGKSRLEQFKHEIKNQVVDFFYSPDHLGMRTATAFFELLQLAAKSSGTKKPFPYLPSPFEWCDIPEGYVTIKDRQADHGSQGGTFFVPRFFMAKYPITNAQFNLFVQEGYHLSQYWAFSEDAQKWHEQNPKAQVSAFNDREDLPRTNISWYEAVAYCHWLSYATGLQIDLPTENEWQRAAQGNSNYLYPWGNSFNKKFLNYYAKRTTPVTRYEEGKSEFGVTDMSGNVWEWTRTQWTSGEDQISSSNEPPRVLRGGSWNNINPDYFTCSFRRGFIPSAQNNTAGFRITARQLQSVTIHFPDHRV